MAQKINFNNDEKRLLQTPYGDYQVEQPLIDLIQSPTMQRLKKMTMGGVYTYSEDTRYKDYTRYEHSIWVLALLKYFGASLKEQVAGLLHDVSHTVFSHVGDLVFEHKSHSNSYQDEIHEWFLKKQKIDELLKKYNLSLEDILHKSGHHKRLEQNLPNICVDRLEYTMTVGSLNLKSVSQKDIKQMLKNLKFENENFFFTNIQIAKKFASISLYCTQNYWTDPASILTYQWLAKTLKRAVEIKLITYDDIHFSTDDIVWNKLKTSNDQEILDTLEKIIHYKDRFETGDAQNYDQILYGKFRGINPFVKVNNKLERLTKLDSEFAKEFDKVKNIVQTGHYVILY